MQPSIMVTSLRPYTSVRAVGSPGHPPNALLRAGSSFRSKTRPAVVSNARKPGDIDMGPNRRASSAFQDMRNAQESYLSDEEEERKTAASAEQNRKHASGGPQKDTGAGIDIDSAPESGTVREAAYPFDRDHSATESDEENRKQ